jgi:hypothetical protein
MSRQAFDAAVKAHGVWLPEDVFLSLVPAEVRTPHVTADDMADHLDILTFSSATGTLYRTEDLKAALGYR